MSVEENVYALEKKRIAKSFGSAAKHYELVDQLQRTIADRLIERLDYFKLEPTTILDLGSGPGTSAKKLSKYYKKANITEVDISQAMLIHSASNSPRFFSKRSRLCSDAEALAVRSRSVDLVYSNLMLQWCDDLDLALQEARRVLLPNGLLLFSTFGPDTLKELRKSWQLVDEDIHVNAFVDMHDIGDALIRAGMENPVMETETITLEYQDAKVLMQELKMIGAHNVNKGRRKTLTGKTRLRSMLSHYEQWRVNDYLPATYEVIYGHAWKPEMVSASKIDAQTHSFPISAITRSSDQNE
jgi:malonyl-CoA O-methyltransferase